MPERAAVACLAVDRMRQVMVVAQLPAVVIQRVGLRAVVNRARAAERDTQREETQLEQRAFFAGFADDVGAHVVRAFGRDVAAGRRRCQGRADDFEAMVQLNEALVRIGLQAHRTAQVGDARCVLVVDLEKISA